jgi:predicted DsbA family dithiol-disulfide isomerase
LTELFPAGDIARMMDHLRTMAAPFGIAFIDRPFLSNSRLALQAAEFSREQGRFSPFHDSLFAAYFSYGLDIGNLDVLRQISLEAGLDPDAMAEAVRSNKFLPKLDQAREEAARHNVSGVPAFILAGSKSVVGAQPLDVFRKVLRSLADE